MSHRRYRIAPIVAISTVLIGAMAGISPASAVQPTERGGAKERLAAVTTPPEHVVLPQQAASPEDVAVDPNVPADEPDKGLVWKGLKKSRPQDLCQGSFEATVHGNPRCTHGPDPAPPGVDVQAARSVEEIAASTIEASTTAEATAGLPCYGDGTSGNRVQAIYARSSDVADRYGSFVSMFPQWAANANRVFVDSAAKTGGLRNVRWVTDANCDLAVARVQLSTAGDDSFNSMMSELWNLGFSRTDRKYVVWVDAGVYCGIGDIDWDDRALSTNYNNVGPSFARIDRSCWGLANPVEAHEIMHNLGGVQQSAPHATSGWHCNDESDRMCYADGSTGATMSYPCASTQERLFDCGNDDYFHSSPTATSYLGSHWNSAMSAFLEAVSPDTAPPPTTTTTVPATTTTVPATTTTVSPTTTTTVPPSGTMTTDRFSGSIKKSGSRTYTVVSGAGTMTSSLSFSGATSMTVTVKASNGVVVGQKSGPSVVSLPVSAAAGSYSVVVSRTGSGTASFSLSVTHPTS